MATVHALEDGLRRRGARERGGVSLPSCRTRWGSLGAEFAAAIASICFGASVVATRYAVSQIEPVSLAFLRYVIAVACLSPMARSLVRRSMPRRDILAIGALGAMFFGVFPWSFSAALTYIPSSRVAIELATMPLLTLMVSRIRGYDQLTPRTLLGQLLAFVGLVFALRSPGPSHAVVPNAWIGDALVAVTAGCGAIYNVFSRPYLQRYSPMPVTAMSMVAGVAFLAPFAASHGVVSAAAALSRSAWLAVLFLGAIGGALGFFLWIWALTHASPSRVAVFFPLNPITAIALSALLLHEPVTRQFLVGLCAVLGGIVLANLRTPPRHA